MRLFTCPATLALVLVLVPPQMQAQTRQPLGFLPAGAVVLFQGDSITDGGRQRTGSDYNHIMGQDYAYLIAAEVGADAPQRNLTFLNRGVSGDRVGDLSRRWEADTLAIHPALLSILVGINDFLGEGTRAVPPAQFAASYDQLLAQTARGLPATKVLLATPFLLPVGRYQAGYQAHLVELRQYQAIVIQMGAKYHLPVIDYQHAFEEALQLAPAEHWSWDGVHPTYAGHGLMAREWLRAASNTWNAP